LRRVALVFASIVAVVAGTGLTNLTSARADGAVDTIVLTNQERQASGLGILVIAPDLEAAAQRHAEEMASAGALWHTPNLATVVGNWRRLGENVGRGPSASAIHSGFMGSPTHRANVLQPAYTQIGVGDVIAPDGRLYISVLYRQPMTARSSTARTVVHNVTRPALPQQNADVQVAAATVSKGDPPSTEVGVAAKEARELAAGQLRPVSTVRTETPALLAFLALALLALTLSGHALRLRGQR